MGESTTKSARFACPAACRAAVLPAALPCRYRLPLSPAACLPCLPLDTLPLAVILPPALPLCFPACLPLGFAVLGFAAHYARCLPALQAP